MKHNYDKWAGRIHNLKNKGAFRTPLPRAQWESIEAPKFAGNVHHVKSFIGPEVEDQEGKRFPIKQVLPVGHTAHNVNVPDELFPNAARRSKQKEALKDYALELKNELRQVGELTLIKATQFLQGLAGFEDTLEVQRVPAKGRLRLLDFRVEGAGVQIMVRLPKTKPGGEGGSASGSAEPAPQAPQAAPKNYLSALLKRQFKK